MVMSRCTVVSSLQTMDIDRTPEDRVQCTNTIAYYDGQQNANYRKFLVRCRPSFDNGLFSSLSLLNMCQACKVLAFLTPQPKHVLDSSITFKLIYLSTFFLHATHIHHALP